MMNNNHHIGTETAPGFFSCGFAVQVTNNNKMTNAPGIASLDAFWQQHQQHAPEKLSRFMLTHYNVEAASNAQLVDEFWHDCLSEVVASGGVLPHASIFDWLYFRGYH
ncbi:hypothetical protein SG34_020220 [Thalassomonas viridans]|uniref:Uncharacterized protein n=1 Tax=Thalassomonas viridans TaxID=137584 RepID=A0AAF0C8A9_9GAMM|nr:hypothetical protein [Thalassomonas viridans]WDE03689.1 hypothetical protein SG34_020220 [Thalassomonas viridans]